MRWPKINLFNCAIPARSSSGPSAATLFESPFPTSPATRDVSSQRETSECQRLFGALGEPNIKGICWKDAVISIDNYQSTQEEDFGDKGSAILIDPKMLCRSLEIWDS
jgi:hypothetical protein